MNNTLINYIEFKSTDLEATRQFYSQLFGWEFKAYGERYIAFSGAGIDGGFELTDEEIQNGVLVVLYHRNLEEVLGKLKQLKTVITRPIFSFPGGRRLQFLDPSGNELAIWSE